MQERQPAYDAETGEVQQKKRERQPEHSLAQIRADIAQIRADIGEIRQKMQERQPEHSLAQIRVTLRRSGTRCGNAARALPRADPGEMHGLLTDLGQPDVRDEHDRAPATVRIAPRHGVAPAQRLRGHRAGQRDPAALPAPAADRGAHSSRGIPARCSAQKRQLGLEPTERLREVEARRKGPLSKPAAR